MSSLVVEVCEVLGVRPHPNADRLAIATVKGWETAVVRDPAAGTDQFRPGDKCVYFPPDTVLPPALSDRLGVTKYLGELPKGEDGTRPPGGRVRVANLRGFKSFGLIMACEDPAWPVGLDVAAHYGVTKFEPPPRADAGDAEKRHPAFHAYYGMEHLRNFPAALAEGEEVVCTEKIHGENCRLGLVREDGVWRWMAGSHDVRRRRFARKDGAESVYWRCFTPAVRGLLAELSGCGQTPGELDGEPPAGDAGHDVVVFGERFGSGVQDMWYGHAHGRFSFRAFDVTVDGRYLDADDKASAFARHGVPAVPVVYRGPYSFAAVEALAEGPTLAADAAGGTAFREGVVVLAVRERQVVNDKRVLERAQFKCVSFTYLNRKGGTEYH